MFIAASGVPVGMQFVARYGREDVLFGLAAQLERAGGFMGGTPALHVAGLDSTAA
jgi:amidase